MDFNSEIYEAIPHRPPFLWIDTIISHDADRIITEKFIPPDLELFRGHYPGNPLMPGVLLCEAVFQTGALLMAKTGEISSLNTPGEGGRTPVLTRIREAKFKRAVKPGETIRMHVTLEEQLGNAWFFKGKVIVGNETAVKVNFACAFVEGLNTND